MVTFCWGIQGPISDYFTELRIIEKNRAAGRDVTHKISARERAQMLFCLWVGFLGNILFLAIEIKEMFNLGFEYFTDGWSLLDIITLTLTGYTMSANFNAVYHIVDTPVGSVHVFRI